MSAYTDKRGDLCECVCVCVCGRRWTFRRYMFAVVGSREVERSRECVCVCICVRMCVRARACVNDLLKHRWSIPTSFLSNHMCRLMTGIPSSSSVWRKHGIFLCVCFEGTHICTCTCTRAHTLTPHPALAPPPSPPHTQTRAHTHTWRKYGIFCHFFGMYRLNTSTGMAETYLEKDGVCVSTKYKNQNKTRTTHKNKMRFLFFCTF